MNFFNFLTATDNSALDNKENPTPITSKTTQKKYSTHQLNYISPVEVVEQLLKENDVAIIDVRAPHEYVAGHIKTAINLPSVLWEDNNFVNQVMEEYGSKNKHLIVHCHYSQQRGPTCAKLLLSQLQDNVRNSGDTIDTEINVLEGGFKAFQSYYGEDSDLIVKGMENEDLSQDIDDQTLIQSILNEQKEN